MTRILTKLRRTISRLISSGSKVSILTISGHLPPLYKQIDFDITQNEALEAYKELGIEDYEFSKIPATFVHQQPVAKLNGLISIPIVLNSFNLAETKLAPEPQNGSKNINCLALMFL